MAATWVWMAADDSPQELQRKSNDFLRRLDANGGRVVSTDYDTLYRTSSPHLFTVCVTYQGFAAPLADETAQQATEEAQAVPARSIPKAEQWPT